MYRFLPQVRSSYHSPYEDLKYCNFQDMLKACAFKILH